MKNKILFRVTYFIIGAIIAFILFQLNTSMSDSVKTWLVVAYIIFGIIITEVLITRKSRTEKAR